MRKLLLLFLLAAPAVAQNYTGAYSFDTGSWAPITTTSSANPLPGGSTQPPPAALTCFSTTLNTWVAWTSAACGIGGGGGGTIGPSVPPNMSSWYVSPYCGSQLNCTQIYGDTQFRVDATSNSTTTLTCADCAFTSADVGKVAWATTQGTTPGVGYLTYTTFVCPQTTIASVTNATTVVLTDACTANGTSNVVFIWGHDDGTVLNALDASVGCSVVHFATNSTFIMIGKPMFNRVPTDPCHGIQSSSGAGTYYLLGDGFGASQAVFVITPNFQWGSSCPVQTGVGGNGRVCIGGQARGIANIQVWGTGLTSASNSNCANGANEVVLAPFQGSSVIYGVDLSGICPGQSGMEGVEVNSYDENFDLGGAQEVGQYACVAHGPATQLNFRANDCLNTNVTGGQGLLVNNGAVVYTFSNYPLIKTLVTGSNSVLISTASYFGTDAGNAQPVEVASGAKLISYADTFATGAPGSVLLDSGGTFISSNSIFGGIISNTGTFISNGGNKMNSLITTAAGGKWVGTGVLFGACRGTATSSATLGLYGLGQFSTPNCTSTTVNQGVATPIVPLSGSVFGLSCVASHAGVSASSGVVTVLKNASSTTLTCTIGTGTSCRDNSHFDVPVIGDVYSIQFTTQGSEVLADVSCTLLAW